MLQAASSTLTGIERIPQNGCSRLFYEEADKLALLYFLFLE
jgi:hypothetical protein